MSTVIRPNISKSNKYYIPKERYYELKYFCLQYGLWKRKRYEALLSLQSPKYIGIQNNADADPTGEVATITASLTSKISMVEEAIMTADKELYSWLLKGVTVGVPYTGLYALYEIPCSRDTYYDRYRKFFYILDKMKE